MGLRNIIEEVLKDKYFNTAVDLGCGPGRRGELFKPHAKQLIGVDHHYGRLNVAVKFSGYDKGIWTDILEYELPSETEAVFVIDVIEHITKQEGLDLLNRISQVPFIIITTPTTFFRAGTLDHHVSLWTPEEFINLGFKVKIINYDFPESFVHREVDCIFAVKGGELR
jgi:hypothetical protein